MTARLTGWIAGLALVLRATAGLGQDVVHYYHLDAVGNILAVTDTSGTVVEQHDYLPFGEEWCGTQVCSSVTPGQPKRFTGKERDAETGLDYFGARYYASKIARFTTIDPVYTWRENLVDPQRWNRYAYARNNPLRYVDPDGRAIDVVADVAFIGYDLFDIGRSVYRGEGVSGTQLLALGGDVVGAAIPFATGVGAAIRAGGKLEHAVEAGRAAEQLVQAQRAEARTGRGVDFVVAADGTAIPVSQSRMREGFNATGFPSRPATQTAEQGAIHQVPTRYGATDVRTMGGSAHHPRRAVTTRAGTNDPTKLSGERFRGNVSQAERRDASHLKQDP